MTVAAPGGIVCGRMEAGAMRRAIQLGCVQETVRRSQLSAYWLEESLAICEGEEKHIWPPINADEHR